MMMTGKTKTKDNLRFHQIGQIRSREVLFQLYGPSLYIPIGKCQFPISSNCKKPAHKYYRVVFDGQMIIFSVCEFHNKYIPVYRDNAEITREEAFVFEIMQS